MKKLLFLFILCIFISVLANAQQGGDTLYLKNGSIVYGKLVEVKDNLYRIKTADGFLFSFASDEVEKFTLEGKSEKKKIEFNDPNGFGFGIETGFLIGESNEHFPILFVFNPMLTYTLKTHHTFGFVSGVEIFDQLYLPLQIEYRTNILKRSVSPFIYARGGGLIPLSGNEGYEDYKGGWTFGIGTGFRWPIADFESYIKFGFRYAYTVHTEDYTYNTTFPVNYTYHEIFYRFVMKWGFKF